MKSFITTISLLLFTSLLFGQGNLRFSYTVTNNGANTVVDVFVQNIAAGTENMTSFTMNAYYDNTESSLTNFDVSPTNSLGWLSLPSSSTFNSAANGQVPITHTGFGNVNVLDFFSTGTSIGQTPTKILTINFDNTPGTAAGSSIFLTSFTDGHDAQVYNDNVSPIPNAYPVIMSQSGGFPVEWLGFEAKALDNSRTQLTWTTGSEINNAGFYVERSTPETSAMEWETLGFVAGAGTTTQESNYEFVDELPFTGENLYRIRQVDHNGGVDLSEVRSVFFEANFSMLLYPNPATISTTLEVEVLESETISLELLDLRGRMVKKTEHQLNAGTNELGIRLDQLPEGAYTIRVRGPRTIGDLRLMVL